MRAFVTGGHGFVGGWLRQHLEASGDEVTAPPPSVDVTDGPGLAAAMTDARPQAVYHLAGFTHVGQSWDAPEEAFRVNALGALNLLEAARRCPSPPRVLLVSSAEVYGRVDAAQLPITETAPLRPVSPYAASKVAAEYLGVQAYLGRDLPVLRVRPFNHIGAGQSPDFVVSAMAKRITEAEQSGRQELRVGNLSPRRDFTDVRDVVRAYRLALVGGQVGEAYNVCSGTDMTIGDLVRRLADLSGVDLHLVGDPALERPTDVDVLRGDAARLRAATGWVPEVPLDDTLRAVLDYWRSALTCREGDPSA
ncbi:MAG: hypothetical protein DLM54_03515 [Acidimicrobiales bacterium]|nr:MAG: hypothetical protein DLM54_03515 [Acidimicrobiales bacterium]